MGPGPGWVGGCYCCIPVKQLSILEVTGESLIRSQNVGRKTYINVKKSVRLIELWPQDGSKGAQKSEIQRFK